MRKELSELQLSGGNSVSQALYLRELLDKCEERHLPSNSLKEFLLEMANECLSPQNASLDEYLFERKKRFKFTESKQVILLS